MGHSNSLDLQTITSIVFISVFFSSQARVQLFIFYWQIWGRGCFLKYSQILSETQVFWFDPKFNAVLKWHNNLVLANTGLNFTPSLYLILSIGNKFIKILAFFFYPDCLLCYFKTVLQYLIQSLRTEHWLTLRGPAKFTKDIF